MEDVAAATGVPKATLYYYFEGKEDILAFLFTSVLDAVERAIAEATGVDGTAADRLRAAVLAHLRVFDELPAASRALQFDLGRAARLPLIGQRTDAAFLTPVAELLADGAADGSLRAVAHPRLVAVALLGAITTVGINAVSLDRSRSVEDIAGDVVDLVLGGLAA
jgi:AcrR family transcriptional regulator